MSLKFETTVNSYLQSRNLSRGTHLEYAVTVKKWNTWGKQDSLEKLDRKTLRDFLDWVYQCAIENDGTNPGRTANKARKHLRAVMSWAWEVDLLESLPRFPQAKPFRHAAGRHYLTKPELNALYFATYDIQRPKGWKHELSVGQYWRSALTLFYSYGLDTGSIWKLIPCHEPIRWRHICWDRTCPDGRTQEQSPWGWIFYRRVKTGKTFYRPMNRVVSAHIRKLMPEDVDLDAPVFHGGGARPNSRFRELCDLAGIKPKTDVETGEQKPWLLKDLRKTCATFYDQHIPESSIEILGHSVGGVTYRHYAHRDPLAFKAIMTLPQPSAFLGLTRGIDGECPCCRRAFGQS